MINWPAGSYGCRRTVHPPNGIGSEPRLRLRKTLIVALARNLFIALWRLVARRHRAPGRCIEPSFDIQHPKRHGTNTRQHIRSSRALISTLRNHRNRKL
jgi:hypothetical protein